LLRPHGALRQRRALVQLSYNACVGGLGLATLLALLALTHKWHVRITLPHGGLPSVHIPTQLPPTPPPWPSFPPQPSSRPAPPSPWWSVQAPPPSNDPLRRLEQFRPMNSIMRALGCQVRFRPTLSGVVRRDEVKPWTRTHRQVLKRAPMEARRRRWRCARSSPNVRRGEPPSSSIMSARRRSIAACRRG